MAKKRNKTIRNKFLGQISQTAGEGRTVAQPPMGARAPLAQIAGELNKKGGEQRKDGWRMTHGLYLR